MPAVNHELAGDGLARGKDRALDLLRQLHLAGETLALHHLGLRLHQRGGHAVDLFRQETELGPIREPNRRAQIPAPDPLDAGAERSDGPEEERHQPERQRGPGEEKRSQDQELLPADLPHRLLDVGPVETHEGAAEDLAARIENRSRRHQHLPVPRDRFVRPEGRRGRDGDEPRGRCVGAAQEADVRVALDVAVAVQDHHEGQLGLARLHLPGERRQGQLGVIGHDGARAREGEVSSLEHQAALDLPREDVSRPLLHERGHAEHDERREHDRGARDDPADAPNRPARKNRRHRPSPRISRVRACCVRARAMYPAARESLGSTWSTRCQQLTASSSFPDAKNSMPRIRYS